MRTRILIATFSMLICSLAPAVPALAVHVPSCGGDFVLFAQQAIRMENGPTVINGNILVNSPTGFIEVGAHNVINGTATAHRLVLGSFAQINTCVADIFQGADENAVCGTVVTPVSPPLPCLANYPPIPAPAVPACVDTANDVTVPAGQTVNLTPGCYQDVRINTGGTLNLGGTYNFRSVLMQSGSSLNGPATVNVKNTFFTEAGVAIKAIQLNVPKVSTAAQIVIGPNSSVTDSVLNAPFAKIILHIGTGLANSEVVANVIVIEPIEATPLLPGPGVKSGVKFNDVNGSGAQDPGEPGIPGWVIKVFNFTTHALVDQQTTGPNGEYSFNLLPGKYVVCEVLQAGWNQTLPANTNCSFDSTLAPGGYVINFVGGENETGNDFGNHQAQLVGCPEDPKAVCTKAVGAGGFATVQSAYSAAIDGDVICMFTNTTENVVLDGAKSLEIVQCATSRVSAKISSLPVWTISSTGKLTIIGPDAQGGTIGWLIDSDGHDIRGVRTSGASQIGIKVTGDNNSVSFNSVSDSPVGVRIEGSSNDVRGGTVSGNTAGVQLGVSAVNNGFRAATVRDNAGIGIAVQGPGNTLDGNRVYGNTGHGIQVTGTATSTKLKSNQSGNPENGGAEYQLDTNAVNLGGNRADGVSIPAPLKCPLFPQAETCE
jgi:hypothetical protein